MLSESNVKLTPEQVAEFNALRCARKAGGGLAGKGGVVKCITLRSTQIPNFPEGWKRKAVARTEGKTFGKVTIFYEDPAGTKYRSLVDAVGAFESRGESKAGNNEARRSVQDSTDGGSPNFSQATT